MNSYNENLHSSIITSLNEQELELKKIGAKLDASKFSLYYAEGAKINAAEKLETANKEYVFQQQVKNQAVENSNISTNLLASADQGKSYVTQTVTNTSVAAANVQVAANAILRLASDVGSIFSIVNAADFGSEIYDQSNEAYQLMNQTAYVAEKTSQHSMEASTLIAEVSATTIADKAKVTNTSVQDLLKVVNTEFDKTATTVATDNTALATASKIEKKAEGVLEDVNVEYYATHSAYQLNNKELNLDLAVKVDSNTEYTVSFDYYKSPFPKPGTEKSGYPVKNYYIMLVKDNKKSTFSINNAEGILSTGKKDQYIEIASTPKLLGQHKVEKSISMSELRDSNGDEMELGKAYTVFVLTVFTNDYKKLINTFDDYLSAPSATFTLANTLSSPKPDAIVVTREKGHLQKLSFHLEENKNYNEVAYRCMFLPDNKDLITGLLTEKGLRSIENEVEEKEHIADKFDPVIAEQEAVLNSLRVAYTALKEEEEENQKAQNTVTDPKEKQKLVAEGKRIEKEIKKTSNDISTATDKLEKAKNDRKAAIDSMEPVKQIKPGFFFDLKIAELITAANYTVAKKTEKIVNDKLIIDGEMHIEPETTDNFGNRLIDGNLYIPVVVSVFSGNEENKDQFTNALSNFEKTKSFTYQIKEAITTKA